MARVGGVLLSRTQQAACSRHRDGHTRSHRRRGLPGEELDYARLAAYAWRRAANSRGRLSPNPPMSDEYTRSGRSLQP